MRQPARTRVPAPAGPLALLAAALVLGTGPVAAQEADLEWTDELRAGETLRVFSVNGEITTRRAAGRTARVVGRGEADGRGRYEIRFEARRVDDGVVVCALYEVGSTCDEDGIDSERGSRSRYGRAHLQVEVPEGVELRVSSGNGDVAVEGATADVDAASGNGDVRVGAGAGRVRAASGNGEVTVEEARAAVRASSGNGAIRVSTAAGPVSASTGNGSIRASMASLAGSEDLEFSSGNGSITLLLPDDFSAEISARTGHGDFDLEFPVRIEGRMSSTRLQGTIGEGTRRLTVATGNGSIHLRRAR